MAEQAETTDTDPEEQYGQFETEDGDLIVYDRDDETAWLQSDTASPVEN